MSQLFDWTAVALLAGLLTGTFVGFRGAEPRLWMRVVLAFFGLGLLIITPIIAWSVSNGTSMSIPAEPGLVLLALTAFLWFNIIRHALRPRPEPEPGTEPRRWGCFRTLFAIAAFIVVGYAGFVIVVFGLGGLMASSSLPQAKDMTTRKTLALNPEVASTAEAPALKKKGRGWEISDKRLDALHEQARELRRHSTEAHKALAAKFTAADLGRYTFKRHAVVGSAIVDFNCHNLGLALAIDEEGQNDALAKRRDKSLESVGIKVMRIAAKDILENLDEVLKQLTQVMRERIEERKAAARAHKAANPKQTYSRPKPRGSDRDDNPRAPQRNRSPKP